MITSTVNLFVRPQQQFVHRSQFPVDRVQMLMGKEETFLQGFIGDPQGSSDGSETQVVDRRVSVWSPVDKATRAKNLAHWQKVATEKYVEAGGSAVVAVGSGVAGTYFIMPWLTWPLCASSTVNAVLATFQGLSASMQATRWADPVPRIAELRRGIGERGFEDLFRLSKRLVAVTEVLDLDIREIVCPSERKNEWTKSVTLLQRRHGVDSSVGIFPSEHAMLAEFFVEWSPLSTAGIRLGVEAPTQNQLVRGQQFDWFKGRLSNNAYTVGRAHILERRDAALAKLDREFEDRISKDTQCYEGSVGSCRERARNAILQRVNYMLHEWGRPQMMQLPVEGVKALPIELRSDPTVRLIQQELQAQITTLTNIHQTFQLTERAVLTSSKAALSEAVEARLVAIRARQTAANTAMIRAMRLLSGQDDKVLAELSSERRFFEHSEELMLLESAIKDLLARTFVEIIPVYTVVELRT